jgi:hypothetical protein
MHAPIIGHLPGDRRGKPAAQQPRRAWAARKDGIMVKQCFARSFDGPKALRVLAVLASTTILFAAGTAYAKPVTAEACHKKYIACQARCESRIPKDISLQKSNDLLFACMARTCNKQYDNCMKNVVVGGGTKAEQPPRPPLHPKGGKPRMPPTGDSKDEPKKPPKVNDTRPPMGGGVFHPKSSDVGGGGPILKSSSAGAAGARSSGRH